MKLVIAISVFILCIIKRRSKIVLVLTMIALWFLMTYCGGTLDNQNYIDEFNNISLSNTTKEPLYVAIVLLFKSTGLSYEAYHAITSAIVILIIGLVTYKLAINYNLVLGLFLIYPFALYVVQIRNCFAFSICMIGLLFLNKNNENANKRSWIRRNKYEVLYVFFVICASLIHSAYILFLLFLLAEKFDLRGVVIATLIALAVESVIMNKTILLSVAELFGVRKRLEYALMWQSITGQSDIHLRVIITFVMYLIFFAYLIYIIRNKYDEKDRIGLEVYNQDLFALKLNILCLVIIPVVPIVREIFRIQEALMLYNYIVITNNMDLQESWKLDTIRNWLIIGSLLMVIFADDYLYILRFAQMREFVLHAVFG